MGGHLNKDVLLEQGVPQGDVITPYQGQTSMALKEFLSLIKDQFRQIAFSDESCRGLTMKAMRCLLIGFSLDPFLKIMQFLFFLHFAFIKN